MENIDAENTDNKPKKNYAKTFYDKHKHDPQFIEKLRNYTRKWRENNREKYNAYMREFSEKNKQSLSEYRKAYHASHPRKTKSECDNEKPKHDVNYYQNNREKVLQSAKTYYQKHKEERKAYQREYKRRKTQTTEVKKDEDIKE